MTSTPMPDVGGQTWRVDAVLGRWGADLARKSLLATAGLVSVHDRTWTTDRHSAARRWGQIEPVWATSLNELHRLERVLA